MPQYPQKQPITQTSPAYRESNILLMASQRLKNTPPTLQERINTQISSYLLVHKEQALFMAVDQLLKHHSL